MEIEEIKMRVKDPRIVSQYINELAKIEEIKMRVKDPWIVFPYINEFAKMEKKSCIVDPKFNDNLIVDNSLKDEDMELKSTLYYRPPEGFPTSYKVKRDSHSDAYLKIFGRKRSRYQQIDCRPKKSPMPTFKESLTKVLLEQPCLSSWHIIRLCAEKTGDYSFYKEAIVAAANFVCLLASKDGIYDYSTESLLGRQMNDLWTYVSNLGKRGNSIVQVWKKSIRRLRSDKTNKYSLVTEPHIAGLIYDYYDALQHWPNLFDQPYFRTDIGISYSRFSLIEKDSIYIKLNNEVRNMDSCLSLRVEGYTNLLVMIARGEISEIVTEFLPRLLKEKEAEPRIDHEFYFKEQLQELTNLFHTLATQFKREICRELADLTDPFTLKHNSWDFVKSAAVSEVIEVAELRRRALGRRFISRDLFLWSIYKCGHGLPPRVCDGLVLNTGGEDHPLSQIYSDVVELIASLGVKTIELEHFIFVLLYPDEIDVDVKHTARSYVQQFKDFMKVVDTDMKVRPQVTARQDDIQDRDNIEGGLFNLRLKKLKPKFGVA